MLWRSPYLVSILLIGFSGACAVPAAEEISILPQYTVGADVVSLMIPREQVRGICDEARPFRASFELSTVTFIKAPTSLFKLPPHCFIRDRAGRPLEEITNSSLQFPVDQSWTSGYLSSNQPEVYSAFYLMLRPRLGTGPITVGAAARLLHDYTSFAEERLKDAISHYGAAGAWCIQLRWMTVPDEIDFVATSPAAAAAIAQRAGGESHENTVRVSSQSLGTLAAQHGTAYVVAEPSEVDVVTPWRFTTGLPPVRDHAALIQLGWVRYRVGSQAPRTDFVGLLLNSPAPSS